MAYMNDPRENRFGPNGEVWENDNRVEKRYRWNGAFVDLCDLPPQEYATTIFHTTPYVPPEPIGPVDNEITITSLRDNVQVTYIAKAEKPVTSDVVISFTVEGGQEPVKIQFKSGDISASAAPMQIAPETATPEPKDFSSDPVSDKKYNYKVNAVPFPEPQPSEKTFNFIFGTVKETELETFDGPEMATLDSVDVEKSRGCTFKLVIPAYPEGHDPFDFIDYALVVAMPSAEIDNYDIMELAGGLEVNKTGFFVPHGEPVKYLGTEYQILACTGSENEFASDPEDIIFDYKLKKR